MNSKLILRIAVIQSATFFLPFLILYIILSSGFGWAPFSSFFFAVLAGVLSWHWSYKLLSKNLLKRMKRLVSFAESHTGPQDRISLIQRVGDEVTVLEHYMQAIAKVLKKNVAKIEGEKEKVASILNSLHEGVIALDARRHILFMNGAAENLLQVKPLKEGRTLIEAVHNAKVDKVVEQAIQSSKVLNCEVQQDLTKKMIHYQAMGIESDRTKICGLLVISDVTDMRRLEGMRRDFVANVSHELRTPLTSIRGFVETLLGGAFRDVEQSARFLQLMEKDALRLNRLIDELLELSRIESEKVQYEMSAVSIRELFEEVILLTEGLQQAQQIEVKNLVDSENDVYIFVDKDKIKQVLINLFDNAIKFNRKKGQVILSAEKLADTVRIKVEDTGYGIPTESVNRVFERFYRVDKARSRELGGSGLGLSIVKHLVEAHGGAIRCESQLGEGTTFTISLPLK